MIQIILYAIVLIISIYQIIKKRISKKEYELLPFMIATSCLVISKSPNTDLEIMISIISSVSFIMYTVDCFILNNFKRFVVDKRNS